MIDNTMSKNWPKDRKCDPETGYCPDTYSCDYCSGLKGGGDLDEEDL